MTKVVLDGEALGTFTLEIDEILGDQTLNTLVFSDIPVAADTVATFSLDSLKNATALAMDVDGDGTTDVSLVPGEDIALEDLLVILKGIIKTLDLPEKREAKLLKTITKIEKKLLKDFDNDDARTDKLEHRFDKLIHLIQKYEKKGFLTPAEVNDLVGIIDVIKKGVVS